MQNLTKKIGEKKFPLLTKKGREKGGVIKITWLGFLLNKNNFKKNKKIYYNESTNIINFVV